MIKLSSELFPFSPYTCVVVVCGACAWCALRYCLRTALLLYSSFQLPSRYPYLPRVAGISTTPVEREDLIYSRIAPSCATIGEHICPPAPARSRYATINMILSISYTPTPQRVKDPTLTVVMMCSHEVSLDAVTR
ncbi:hypothetical protein P167DRAFT_240978 [Morchella conica CCBAS932]|uniref:Uncharacterized protein n=1 Tax=Morchella conica CCBAS932 TaxID=1392247 RepID=A0A3N4KJR0_9PEZI|nr:hypothetical protein P167DRAFT_240978 [Morchella conica CCBAS932]